MKGKPVYVETNINCGLEVLWQYTQEPSSHEQWDLRFSEITYLPKHSPSDPQKFLYSTRIGFGFRINGIGQSVATKTKNNSESTSVLKFSSENKLSIIKQGSGYWKYVPQREGIKFFTGYDYQTRWGGFGKVFDKLIFRPLMIWATAWSFDCLKKWIEKGLHPKQAIRAQFTVLLSGIALGLVWIYQGLIPKILFADTGELEILKQSALFKGNERTVLTFIGWGEILFGLIILFIHKRFVHIINIMALLLLFTGAIFSNAVIFTFPFNPFSLTVSMLAISTIAILNFEDLPKASNCITKQK